MKKTRFIQGYVAFTINCTLLMLVMGCYSSGTYRGDGSIDDFGAGSGMRYAIEFEPVNINRTGTYTFTFGGAPPERLQGYLAIDSGDRSADLDGARISVQLIGPDDAMLASRDGIFPGDWPPSLLGRYPYALAFFSYKFSTSTDYTLRVEIRKDTGVAPVMATPVFYGGGGVRLP